jgi:hypothetical protein
MTYTPGSWLERAPLGGPQIGVLDTNTIFNDIVYQLRHGRQMGAMVASSRAGAVRLFASSHVYGEVYRRASTQERRGFPAEQLLELFEERYLPQIRFVDVAGLPIGANARAVEAADPDDLPTAVLALALAPCHVYTDDPDLTDAGFGQQRNWLGLVRSAERAMQVDQTMLVLAELARWGWRKLAPWINRQIRETGPVEVMLGGAIGILVLSALPAAGHARLGEAIDAGERFLAGAGELGASAGLGLMVERARRSGNLVESLVRVEEPSVEGALARELASRGPLQLPELARAGGVTAEEVAATLERLACFVVEPSGWALGRHLPPRTKLRAPRQIPVTP